jgi:hypothetical protein
MDEPVSKSRAGPTLDSLHSYGFCARVFGEYEIVSHLQLIAHLGLENPGAQRGAASSP